MRAVGSLSALALAVSALPATAQIDLAPVVVQPIQAIQTGTTPLVGGRSTMVRVGYTTTGTVDPGTQVDGLLRVLINGVEAGFSPIYSVNGPMDPPASSNPNILESTLNFVFIAPTSSDVEFIVEMNPAGPNQVAETDFSNNTLSSGSLNFNCKRRPEFVYVPIDYRPDGGPVPNLPDPLLIEPGMGDNFIQAAFPAPDFEYHRSDAPSKLWTSSLSGTGSSLNASLLTDLQMMDPQPDMIYGWVPGGLPYNGQAIGIPGQAAMGNTELIRYQRTFAHELGHLFGFFHIGSTLGQPGVDVEHHLKLTQNLPQLKPGGLFDIMVAGQQTQSAFIYPTNYVNLYNHPVFQCTQPAMAPSEGPNLLVAGVYEPGAGSLQVMHAVTFGGGAPTPGVAPEQANLILRGFANGREVTTLPMLVKNSADGCAGCQLGGEHDHDAAQGGAGDSEFEPADAGFVAVVPAEVDGQVLDRVTIVEASTGEPVAELLRSDHAPEAAFTSPDFATVAGGSVQVTWEASDADGDELISFLRYSPNGERFVPLASGIDGTSWRVDFDELPGLQTGRGFLELLVSDGLHTTVVRTDDLGAASDGGAEGGGNAPWTHILTPDDNATLPRAAQQILHASGWDLEDRALTGLSIVWTSDLDGTIAVGRLAETADLSVGTHEITVTATDSDGMQSTDTATLTITDRVLPGPGVICQTDLGFGGPGDAVLEVCGGDLSSGTTAEMTLTNAAPSQALLILVSLDNNPTPIAGGTVITSPLFGVIISATDIFGEFNFTVPGGGGPLTLFAQAIYDDPAQAFGLGISNALQVELLP